MTDIDFTALADLVYKSQHFPSHLVVTRNAKTYPDGIWVSIIDDWSTKAYIEVAIRESVEQGKDPLLGLWEHAPKVHVYRQEGYITPEQVKDIETRIQASGIDLVDFLKYMKVESISNITAKDLKKAMTMFEVKA